MTGKKRFVHTFIESIELYPDKHRKNGSPIRTVHFKFPVAYNGETVYDFSPSNHRIGANPLIYTAVDKLMNRYIVIMADATD